MVIVTYKYYISDEFFSRYEETTEIFDTLDEFKQYFHSHSMIITGLWVI